MKTCLVVDDSRVTRKVARKILEDLQFEVTEAADGAQALGLCQVQMPQAILLDWNMPVMDGITFLHQLRQTEGGKDPIVLFCTTENDLEHITDALTCGANEYIMKPFNSEIIESKFAEAGLIQIEE